MSDYSQPDFYRFNRDSIELVNFIQKDLKDPQSLADFGAGCGIIGLELAKIYLLKMITFVELQDAFIPHLKDNIEKFLPKETKSEICSTSFLKFVSEEKFDLIVCNPPYYLPGHGMEASNPHRHMARTFSKDSWEILIRKISECLVDTGRAFIVIKNERVIIEEVSKSLLNFSGSFEWSDHKDLKFLKLVRLNKN